MGEDPRGPPHPPCPQAVCSAHCFHGGTALRGHVDWTQGSPQTIKVLGVVEVVRDTYPVAPRQVRSSLLVKLASPSRVATSFPGLPALRELGQSQVPPRAPQLAGPIPPGLFFVAWCLNSSTAIWHLGSPVPSQPPQAPPYAGWRN